MGATFSSNKASKLEQWLVEGIKLKQPEKVLRPSPCATPVGCVCMSPYL
jgi:hypothetical protein